MEERVPQLTEALGAKLRDLRMRSPGVKGSILISTDGFELASDLPSGASPDELTTVYATLASVAGRASKRFGMEEFKMVVVEGSEGYILAGNVSEDVILGILASNEVKLGLLLIETRRTTRELGEIV